MAYPNYYPGYQPGYYTQPVPDQLTQLRQNQPLQNMQQLQPQMQPQMGQPQQTEASSIIWVQGEAGAKAYLVAPGNTVQLWDSENPVIYLKSADMSGMPSMRVLDYTERGGAPSQAQAPAAPQIDLSNFITRDELEDILAERLKKPARAPKAKEDTDNA